jgi:protein SCO1
MPVVSPLVVHWMQMRTFLASALVAVIMLAGCHSAPKPEAQTSAASNFKVYHLRGKIISANPAKGEAMIDGEAIAGYMDAMTMPYKLKDPNILSELHPGDTITADVMVYDDADGTVLLDHIVVVAQGKPDYKPSVLYHVPAPGDPVPNFALRNQDGREIHLDQFRGKALLITFIYTRCPLPNFCPLVTHNFAVIHNELSANPSLYAKTQLLCISFDPKNDTPARLRAYGAQYLGSDSNQAFSHWQFATASAQELEKMALYFDVGITRDANDSITHTLSTTLIGPNGKVAQFYPDNDWTPQQVYADVKQLEASAG